METVFILNKVGLTDKEDFFLHKHNPSDQNKTVEVVADDNTVKDFRMSDMGKYKTWLKELSKFQKQTLKKIYEEDFKLFNYDNSMLD